MTADQAKAQLDPEAGEASFGYVTPGDVKSVIDVIYTDMPVGGGGATTLDGLSDVAAASPTSGQVLGYNGALWAPVTPASGGGGSGFVLVASAQAPADVKAAAAYVCDGTADDVQINAAITAAAAQPSPVTSPTATGGVGRVVLSAGRFWVASPILLRTGVWLHGQGWLTELFGVALGGAGVIQAANGNVHAFRVGDLFINGNGTSGNCHGVYLTSASGDFSARPSTDPDAVGLIENIMVTGTQASSGEAKGIWVAGSGGGLRGTHIVNIRMFNIRGTCIHIDGTSDVHLTGCQVSNDGSGYAGYVIGGGNSEVVGCKAFYCEGPGFNITSSRATLVSCIAQDNGTHGFQIGAGDASIIGGQADSNSRTSTTAAGVYIGSACSITGLTVFDRGQTPGSPQNRGIHVAAAYNPCHVTANVKVPSGSAHVVNPTNLTGQANNLIAITRSGTTPLVSGY